MCGIVGFVNRGDLPADRSVLQRMTRTLFRRGPDDEGLYLDGAVGLGFRRLSIIDVEGGAQPLCNEDGTVWVVFNGEIYNEPELRKKLQSRGHVFRTATDTEVLVHLYEEYGDAFPEMLNGMFGLAIWDSRRRRLLLARDRMGQKPLFYATTSSGAFVFGSEPKALLAHPEVKRSLDRQGLVRYLFYEYIPAPYTIWEGMRKLPRSHTLAWEEGVARVQSYWSPPNPEDSNSETFAEAAERFWSLFRSSVQRHLRSDVPLGVFLSGGIDSSSVAAALAELQPASSIRTYSIGFDDPSFDESGHARSVARALGTDHHEQSFSVDTLRELLPEVVAWLDEPFGDASILPTHLLSRFARSQVKVCLGGDGSDELLAGYPTFIAQAAANVYRRLPSPARGLAAAVVGKLPVNHANVSFDFKLKQFLKGASEPWALAHQRWLGSFSGAEIARVLEDAPGIDVEALHTRAAGELAPGEDPLTRSLLLYQETYLAEDILTKVDRASMACGLEVRAPFLDVELVDAILRMPAHFKYQRRTTKRLLKKAASKRLPAEVLRRPKKGFGIPVARWLRGPLEPMLEDLLGCERLQNQGLFVPGEVQRLIREHKSGARDHRKPLWTLLVFQLWHEAWLAPEGGDRR